MQNLKYLLKKELSNEEVKTIFIYLFIFVWLFILTANVVSLKDNVERSEYYHVHQDVFTHHLVSSKNAFEDLKRRAHNTESKLALMDVGFTQNDFQRSETYTNKELKEDSEVSKKCFDEENHVLVYQCLEKELQNLDKRVKEKLPIFKKEAYMHNKNPKFLNYRGEGHIMDVAYNDLMDYRDSFCALKHGAYTLAQWGDVYELECELIITEDFYNFMVQQIEDGVIRKVWSR